MSLNKTVREALLYGKELLTAKGISDASFVSRLFLSQILDLSVAQLLAEGDKNISKNQLMKYESFLAERISGRPCQYILGQWEFMGLPFFVKEGVLIPRADTEILIESVLNKSNLIKEVLDIGTGSGCIPISLAVHGNMQAVGIDINAEVLELARQNADLNGVLNIKWFEGDLFLALPKEYQGKFDAVVSNPPYIKSGDIAGLMSEVRDFEPHLALDGGADGLDFYRRIITESSNWLKDLGFLFFEIGSDQGREVYSLMEPYFIDLEIVQDLAGLDRVIMGRKKDCRGE